MILELNSMAGGFTVLATKAVSGLISLSFPMMFGQWIFYLMVAVLLVTAVLQISFQNEALKNFDSTVRFG